MSKTESLQLPCDLRDPVQLAAPRVSVVIPAYEVSEYIAETLESVFGQTYTNYEVIIVNDGSPDTPELERAISPYRSRVIYFQQENKGLSGARNTAIRLAKGDLIALLDADDVWLPTFLEEQVAVFDRNPALDLVWADALIFGDPILSGLRFSALNPFTRPVTPATLVSAKCVPLTSCVLVRRQAVIDVGCFDETFRRAEDFDLYLRLAYAGKKLDFQPLVLGKRRIRRGSLLSDTSAQLESAKAACKKFAALAAADQSLCREVENQIARIEALDHDRRGRQHMESGRCREALVEFDLAQQKISTFQRSLLMMLLKTSPRLTLWLKRQHHRLAVASLGARFARTPIH